jgi:hypothetical protein
MNSAFDAFASSVGAYAASLAEGLRRLFPPAARKRRIAAAVAGLCLVSATWMLQRADARAQRRRVLAAAIFLRDLGSMEESYHRLHGRYTPRLTDLANMTRDWVGFMKAADVVLDTKRLFQISADRGRYRIVACARDRRRTILVREWPPRAPARRPPARAPASPAPNRRPR